MVYGAVVGGVLSDQINEELLNVPVEDGRKIRVDAQVHEAEVALLRFGCVVHDRANAHIRCGQINVGMRRQEDS